ncbi:hypothetical protein FQA39_LY07922 [Lamprigera yunnana]|nr:hypothetical protein FQA39_LY07922 [Lamprigera yunnana]
MQEGSRSLKEKPKLPGPKPVIASKPKYVPPVNIKPKAVNDEATNKRGEMSTFYTKERPTHLCENFLNDGTHLPGKGPSSPSTVCCSILSNVGNDCCRIIVNPNKKEFNNKTMSKMESVDSNSSDSGGFKDFIQRDMLAFELKTHQRKSSQPELSDKSVKEQMTKSFTHQRQSSQPEESRFGNRQNFVPTAQALEQFLPQGDYKLAPPKEKKLPLIPHGQFQSTTKKLEEFLTQRIEREKMGRKMCSVDGEMNEDVDQKMAIQKQIQQKLQADLKQTVKQIQEIQSTELRLPQNRKWSESNRSQPAIGLKHTPKSRPTIFGTVASDHTPKDCSNRRSLPQTPGKNFSSIYNGDAVSENATISEFQHDNALVYRDGNLISGPLEALIQHMVPTDVYYPDRAYLFAFLLSSRLFIKPHDLLARVRNLCEIQQGLGSTSGTTQPGLFRFAEHLVQLLAEWTETFPYDFRDERVMHHIRTITQQCCCLSSSLMANVSSLLHNLLQRLTALDNYEKFLEEPQLPMDEATDITDVCPKPEVLAQQLTHVELERLSYIGPEEFVQAFAKENPHIETSFKDMKKTHNLEQYVQWFNRLSYFVATQVIRHLKKKQRVRVVEYWIETGRECFNIGNFNSLMAIIAGLNMSPVSRLKKTWHKIQSGKFAILEHQMDPSSNFSSYRSTLKAAMWRSAGATDQRQRIVIPFFSLLVKDLYFLNQGCSNKLPNGHINFEKFWQLAKQVTEFMAWKQVTCPFEKDQKIIAVLQRGPVLNENALALASFECEQPENNQEKERCKSLKAEGNAT